MEAQLLSLALQHDRPDLETQRTSCAQQESTCRADVARLERQLLTALAASAGSVLDNAELLRTLRDTKAQSAIAEDALQASRALREQLETQRAEYKPFAARGATLYWALRDLARLDGMYRVGVPSFVRLVHDALGGVQGGAGEASRTQALQQRLLQLVRAA